MFCFFVFFASLSNCCLVNLMPKCSPLSLTTTTTLSPCGTCTSGRMHCVKFNSFNIKISTYRKCLLSPFPSAPPDRIQPGANQLSGISRSATGKSPPPPPLSLCLFLIFIPRFVLQRQQSEDNIPLVAADLWHREPNVDLLKSFLSPDPTTHTHRHTRTSARTHTHTAHREG